jgi:hypothetical protein
MKILLLVCLLHLVSCSTYVRTLSTRMISPEAQGKFLHSSLDGARIQSVQTNQFDFSGTTTDKKLSAKEGTYAAGISGEIGLFRRLDTYIIPSLSTSPTIYGLKFQFLGDPKLEAKQGNFSASAIFGLGNQGFSRTDSENELDQLDSDIDEIDVNVDHEDVGLIVGYRWTDKLLHYANGYYIEEKVVGKVTNNSGTLEDVPFKYNNRGMLYSMGAIYYLKIVYFKLDFSHMTLDWDHTAKQTSNSVNFGFGFHW